MSDYDDPISKFFEHLMDWAIIIIGSIFVLFLIGFPIFSLIKYLFYGN